MNARRTSARIIIAACARRAWLLGFVVVGGCAIVPQNRRAHLADPMMQVESDSLDAHRKQKFYSTREAAAGGDGVTAGGGCGCQ